ncbi:bifunctional riboflavin kinase/FAD synthetase [Luteipulveratus sp. YIM 133132]|uniref:bifunctional riboflavin kinase/FAD synthetase n=1 Tax=Luteipulveratus flavus TaxID=3031728 RepID=UPI0023B20411|nr:bifunctional riboflavin kinase/FAD synthetase [Luteipulveratus sp. YIM 133132]MDE9367625.1 bifunctional riboflavin kinase/FAD synthetase [Luteipulveratus sp. YIM 133132]
MLRLTDLSEVPADLGPTVLTLGNFDGVHRGHASVLATVVEQARARGARAVAVTFEPHPLAVLHPESAPPMLTSTADRLDLLEAAGLDAVLLMPFTRELAAQTPEEFVKAVFVDALQATAVIVGKDTRFGVRNSGDIGTLRELGTQYGFEVLALEDVGTDHRWSSTELRALIGDGDVAGASAILGRPHHVSGTVVRGLQRGRELGYPTANLSQDASGLVPADGVYAGWLIRHALPESDPEHRMPAAISVGTNPTFENVARTVEAYVLDRDDLDLYGERVSVQFVRRLRGNDRFESIEALVAQIGRDVDTARAVLTSTT